ncbi:HTH-type transcriptional regulator SarZ [Kordia sp. SMS9]|uniref:MarR family winged helix-turn-helix transcriptional regulator n=1 Tax=Kordia sp. SMS9 TaxID=2282170 RepID=UPI000E0DA421|nr:MarR family transcriptional regulator [Kordia sp. SMS9]AXG70107.1 HTH-type transcriptional regulator SarZ [Kordia sp. SMS9]
MKLKDVLKSDATLPLAKKTAINFFVTNNIFMEKYTSFFKQYDISLQQFNVLRILKGQKGTPANLATIQERMVHKNSNTTRLIDKLITKELVERTICPENRRKVEIIITENGLKLIENINSKLDDLEENIMQPLTISEAETLNMLLEKLRGSQSA